MRRSPLTLALRNAGNLLSAILDYLYALLEVETRIAPIARGLDLGLALFRADEANRQSLAADVGSRSEHSRIVQHTAPHQLAEVAFSSIYGNGSHGGAVSHANGRTISDNDSIPPQTLPVVASADNDFALVVSSCLGSDLLIA